MTLKTFAHKSVGAGLARSDWESTTNHDGGTGRSATYVVASNDAPAHVKRQADYECNGTADDVEIQAAIDALPSGGGKVVLSEGTFNIAASVALVSNIFLMAQGTSTILKPSADVDVLIQGATTHTDYHLSSFTIDGDRANRTAGHGILFQGVERCIIENLYIHDCDNDGLTLFNDASRSVIRNVTVIDNDEHGIFVDQSDDVRIEGCYAEGNGTDGIRVASGSTRNADDVIISHCTAFNNTGFGLAQSATAGTMNRAVISACTSSSNTLEGINFRRVASGSITGNICTDSDTAEGITVYQSDRVDVNGNNSFANNGIGISIHDSSQIEVVGNHVEDNGDPGSAADFPGITVNADAENINHVLISNNQCGGNGTYGINVNAQATRTLANCLITSNRLYDNLTSAYNAGGAGTIAATVLVRGNDGYVTENSGTATITSGNTSVTITHSLDVTPTLDDLSVTFGEQGTNDYGRWWIDTITSTQFNINVSADPGASNLDLAWKAMVL